VTAQQRFTDNLAKRRKRLGLTQADIALACYVSPTVIGRVESGRARLALDLAERIANALGTTVDVMLGTEIL